MELVLANANESSALSLSKGYLKIVLKLFSMVFVYIIKNSRNNLYIGVSTNPEIRVKNHNQKRGALFTKMSPDFKIVFLEKYVTLTQARNREIQIKKWRRSKKEMLIERYKKGLPTAPSTN